MHGGRRIQNLTHQVKWKPVHVMSISICGRDSMARAPSSVNVVCHAPRASIIRVLGRRRRARKGEAGVYFILEAYYFSVNPIDKRVPIASHGL